MFKKSIIILLFPMVLTSINAYFIVFDEEFYKEEFEKHGVYDKFQIPKEDLNKELTTILGFLKRKNELSSTFVNTKEQAHMNDVQRLFSFVKWITVLITLILLATIIYTKDMQSVMRGSIATILLGLVFLLLTVIMFPKMFLWFHQVTFNNDNWQLNPETDNLINLFPREFFYDISFTIFKNTFITASIIFAVALGYGYWRKSWQKGLARETKHL